MKNYKKIIPFIMILLTLLTICGAYFLPKLLLKSAYEHAQNKIETAPESYYLASNTAMSKKASELLESYEKTNLITGAWDSTYKKASYEDAFLTESDAVAIAKENIDQLHDLGFYPYSLTSSYNNWYSWTTSLYSYSDTNFHTYTCYLWIISFTKFDNSLSHTILMTEDGVILAALANDPSKKTSPMLTELTDESIKHLLVDNHVRLEKKEAFSYPNFSSIITQIYPDNIMTGILEQNSILVSLSFDNDVASDYLIYQFNTSSQYVFGIVPIDALDKQTIQTEE